MSNVYGNGFITKFLNFY